MNTSTHSVQLSSGYWMRRNPMDWIFALLVLAAGAYAMARYREYMDVYEEAILIGTVPAMILLAWFWRPLRGLIALTTVFSLLAIFLYQGELGRSEQVFGLKYFLSSQSAILWMCVVFFTSTGFYWIGMIARNGADAMAATGTTLAWVAVLLALVGTMVRWYESYLIGIDIGHIPVSNLYEVFILFCWMTTLFYLYFEDRYETLTERERQVYQMLAEGGSNKEIAVRLELSLQPRLKSELETFEVTTDRRDVSNC